MEENYNCHLVIIVVETVISYLFKFTIIIIIQEKINILRLIKKNNAINSKR